MRAYFFGNMYLSSIQQGIQSAHVVHELFIKYPDPTPVWQKGQKTYLIPNTILYDWAIDYKTMILLNGGYSEILHGLVEFFEEDKNPYPYAHFNEGQDALDGALTCVGIILPEKIYVTADMVHKGEINMDQLYDNDVLISGSKWSFTPWEIKLIQELNQYSLAH